MADVLIRDIPDEVVAVLDARATGLGMSLSEYVRRLLARDTAAGSTVSTADLARFADGFAGLADPDLMAHAWQ